MRPCWQTLLEWLRRLGTAYVELLRNILLLVQMFLWYFVAPELLPAALGERVNAMPDAPFVMAVVCLGFFTSARVAVQVTAGIEALTGHGLRGAASSHGCHGVYFGVSADIWTRTEPLLAEAVSECRH